MNLIMRAENSKVEEEERLEGRWVDQIPASSTLAANWNEIGNFSSMVEYQLLGNSETGTHSSTVR